AQRAHRRRPGVGAAPVGPRRGGAPVRPPGRHRLPQRRVPPPPGHDRAGRRRPPGRPRLPHRRAAAEPRILPARRAGSEGGAEGSGGKAVTPGRSLAAGAAVLTAVGAFVLAPAPAASAHPLGNFTVNRYDGLVAAPGELRVRHVEDLAEIPATQAAGDIERRGGPDAWARDRCAEAARD